MVIFHCVQNKLILRKNYLYLFIDEEKIKKNTLSQINGEKLLYFIILE